MEKEVEKLKQNTFLECTPKSTQVNYKMKC